MMGQQPDSRRIEIKGLRYAIKWYSERGMAESAFVSRFRLRLRRLIAVRREFGPGW